MYLLHNKSLVNICSVLLFLILISYTTNVESVPCTLGAVCYSTKDCNSTSLYCAGPCTGPGRCVARPSGCPTLAAGNEEWICGCDNNNYKSECIARKAGVEINYSGKCAVFGGVTLNSNCTVNAECGVNEYCYFLTGCGTDPSAPAGSCQQRSSNCVDLYSAVCGCDGKSYSNMCNAGSVGVNVERLGSCDSSSQDLDLVLSDVTGHISGSLNTLAVYEQTGNVVDPYKSVYLNISSNYTAAVTFTFNVPTPLLASLVDASGTVLNYLRLEMNWISKPGTEDFWSWKIRKAANANQWSTLGNNNFVPDSKWAVMNNLIAQNPIQFINTKTGDVIIEFDFTAAKSACAVQKRVCLFPALDYLNLFVNYGVKV